MKTIQRQCALCKTELKSTGGLIRHKKYCPGRQNRLRIGREQQSLGINDGDEELPPPLQSPGRFQSTDHMDNPGCDTQWLFAQILDSGAVGGPGEHIAEWHRNEGLVTQSCPEYAVIVESDQRTCTGSSTNVLYTETFEEVTNRTAGRTLTPDQGSSHAADVNAALCGSTPHIERADGVSDEALTVFHPFSSEAEYAQASWWVTNGTSDRAINAWLSDPRLQKMYTSHFACRNAREVRGKLLQGRDQAGSSLPQWKSTVITVDGRRLRLRHRNALDLVSLLIGHAPFKDDLFFSPIRQYSSTGARVYDELHTANWWWDTQEQLPDGATVVPILLASDKTQLTAHAGDKKAWPVYLTIGNIRLGVRQSLSRPALLLLAYLPVCLPGDRTKRLATQHKALEVILKPLEQAARDGTRLQCADGHVRHCFPLLAAFMADYEEQVTLTGIKSGRCCPRCHVPPDQRHDLITAISHPWPLRTHETTLTQLRSQKENNVMRTGDDEDYIRPFRNFAWNHKLSNIHAMMGPDFLHQVLKGLTGEHVMNWIRDFLQSEIQAGRAKGRNIPHEDGRGRQLPLADALLTARFAQVERCADLIVWDNWASLNQWTGKMYKSLLKQIVPVVAPLLKHNEGAMLFIRAFADFAMLSQYTTHDDTTLRYMEAAIYRMDKTKDVFLPYRPNKAGPPNFNIPKLHAITHYAEAIRRLGSIKNTTTEHPEGAHKEQKEFYERTNKRGDYEEQMVRHNTIHLNSTIRGELQLWEQTDALTTADKMDTMQTVRLGPLVDVRTHPSYEWSTDGTHIQVLRGRKINTNLWRTAREVQQRTGIAGLISKIAAFVRECRKRVDGVERTDGDVDRLETDPGWVSMMPVGIHHSVACYIRLGKDASDTNKLDRIFARCTPAWLDTAAPRYDSVMVREYERANDSLRGHKVGRLRLLLSIQDTDRLDGRNRYRTYNGALVETFRVCDGGKVGTRTGLLKVQKIKPPVTKTKRTLDAFRIYDVSHIARPVSLVPTDVDVADTFFVNNYTDWDIYNTIYDDDFERVYKAQVDAFARRQKRVAEG